MTLFGAVELGGTKTDVAVGTSPQDMSEPHRIATTDPDETLSAVIDYLHHQTVEAVGVASFGPLDLDPAGTRFGTMLSTPKPGWSGHPVHATLQAALDLPVAIDTDVNGAALGEGRWGATQGMDNHAYVTVGTGFGAGVVVAGRQISGERHPETGHIAVRRREGDGHRGSCPYHGDCLEGMAAGPALEARFGNPDTWAGNNTVLDVAAHYVSQGLLALVYVAAPERIVVGGGVSSLPGFHDRLRSTLGDLMAGYPEEPDLDLLVATPGLGPRSGLAGGLVLAEMAMRR
ncbi:MAG: ROK family protein [Acidimicrobiia bacterium]|jgi:fructokinase